MRIRGGMGSDPALATPRDPARDRLARVVRKPAIGVAVITPLMLAAAVAASGPSPSKPVRSDRATPLAAVAPTAQDMTGPTVVAAAKPPAGLHIAAATVSAPPPAAVVSAPGALGIPAIALSAYRSAEGIMARTNPNCGVSWNLLAGIGRIESGHANNGATDTRGTSLSPIYGPSLDGSLPGNEIIVASSQLGRVTYARAMGPMQFLPGTWSRYASDGDGDGKADPQNVYDSSLAAARYLCGGGLNLRDPSQVMTAILRYNNSVAYARNVLGWAGGYTTGVVPVNLPPITGPVPGIADTHLDANAHGLGPGLPVSDPLAHMPEFDLGQSDVANQLPVPPGPVDTATHANPLNAPCSIFCIGEETPAVPAPWAQPAPWAAPSPWAPAAPVIPLPTGPAPGPVQQAPAPQPAPAPPPAEIFPAPAPGEPVAPQPAGPLPAPIA